MTCSSEQILIVDDSAFYAQVLRSELIKTLQVKIDIETSSLAALERLKQTLYTLVILDIMMPEMDGLTAIQRVHRISPRTQIVVMSSADGPSLQRMGFDVAVLDTVTFLTKPSSRSGLSELGGHISNMLRQSSPLGTSPSQVPILNQKLNGVVSSRTSTFDIDCIGIVSSTGGSNVLVQILSELPSDYPIPIVIVQHMSQGFLQSFVDWLDAQIQLPVSVVEHSNRLGPGVWFCTEDAHLLVQRGRLVSYSNMPAVEGFRPSGTVLLQSMSTHFQERALGIVLTGLGRDGAVGLQSIHQHQGRTIVQTPESCVIAGMVLASIALGAGDEQLSPVEIHHALRALAND